MSHVPFIRSTLGSEEVLFTERNKRSGRGVSVCGRKNLGFVLTDSISKEIKKLLLRDWNMRDSLQKNEIFGDLPLYVVVFFRWCASAFTVTVNDNTVFMGIARNTLRMDFTLKAFWSWSNL